jgi:MYXO-CTERM domain-containing protein
MRFRTVVLAAALSAGFAPQKGAEPPTVASGRAPRLHRDVTWVAHAGGPAGWRAIVDRDTGVPVRMWGPSLPAAGATKDAAIADSLAHSYLRDHLATLAPGATLADFTPLANVLDPSGTIRTVTFAQHAQGLAVLGGAVSFTFERDRLVMIGSTALPNVSVHIPGEQLPAATLEAKARIWLGQPTVVRSHGGRIILPIVHSRGNASTSDIEYRVVETLSLEAIREAGRWDVWLDATDGEPVARHSTLMFASGRVLFDVPDRWPGATRNPQPAPGDIHTVNGAQVTSLTDGTITWASGTATVSPGLSGPLVAITNKAGALVTEALTLADAHDLIWSKASDGPSDAQLDAYVFANQGKAFVRAKLNPNLTWLDQQLSVNVNENQTCNAFSTGDDIHFFKADNQCENTGRIADVVYHEFGHSVHANSIIPGEGQFDGSLSEGVADTLAVAITGDHGMGRGFFFNDTALRDVGIGNKKWPDDADGEPHDEGEIIGETLWDTRVALQGKLGEQAGYEQFLKVYYAVVQRSPDIPDSFPAALVGDDDNGDLSDGTPNQCEIQTAFAAHGLVDPAATIGLTPPTRDGYNVSLTTRPPSQSNCPPPSVTGAQLTWAPKGGTGGVVDLTNSGQTWTAAIPTQADGTVVLYHVTVTLSDGTTLSYPQNKADTEYQMYVGAVTKLWCADFENGAADWTTSGSPASSNQWEAGPPLGVGGDPKTAFEGTNVFGIDLGSDDGLYRARATMAAESPEIDLAGNTNVRLQYYRWLNVEDGVYDQATIYANDTPVWTNFASQGMPTSDEINHTDKEWRFHDVDLSQQASTGKIKLKFEIVSDPGLELGGWTMDDVCIVATAKSAGTCGNGTVEPGETCDDGNTLDGDSCPATCQDDSTNPGDGDNDGGGCCSVGSSPTGALALGLLTLGLVVVRRRRR